MKLNTRQSANRNRECQNLSRQYHSDQRNLSKLRDEAHHAGNELRLLEGKLIYEENLLVRIRNRIRDAAVGVGECLFTKNPKGCSQLVVSLTGSELKHKTNVARLKEKIMRARFMLSRLEREISSFNNLSEGALGRMGELNCSDLGYN